MSIGIGIDRGWIERMILDRIDRVLVDRLLLDRRVERSFDHGLAE